MLNILPRAFISTGYWKQRGVGILKSYGAILGSLWLITKVATGVYTPVENLMSSWLVLALPLLVAIWRNRPIPFVRHELHGRDITIEVRVGDILKLDGSMVISTNTTFETRLLDGVISSKSLQGQFTKKLYDDNVHHLDGDLEKALDSSSVTGEHRGRRKWPIGTIVVLRPKRKTVYMAAVAELNDHGVAKGSRKDVLALLGKLWHFIGERGELEPVCVPLLGTSRARIATIRREEMVKEIVRSFIAACAERKFTERLVVVISPHDYVQHKMDLVSLGCYVKHLCENSPLPRTAP